MLPYEVCAMQCYCLCSHVLPVHYSGILKKSKESCSLVIFTFFVLFCFKVSYCTCSFFFVLVCFLGGEVLRTGISGHQFLCLQFSTGAAWLGRTLLPSRGGTSTVVVGLVCNKLFLFSPLNYNLAGLFLTHDR